MPRGQRDRRQACAARPAPASSMQRRTSAGITRCARVAPARRVRVRSASRALLALALACFAPRAFFGARISCAPAVRSALACACCLCLLADLQRRWRASAPGSAVSARVLRFFELRVSCLRSVTLPGPERSRWPGSERPGLRAGAGRQACSVSHGARRGEPAVSDTARRAAADARVVDVEVRVGVGEDERPAVRKNTSLPVSLASRNADSCWDCARGDQRDAAAFGVSLAQLP